MIGRIDPSPLTWYCAMHQYCTSSQKGEKEQIMRAATPTRPTRVSSPCAFSWRNRRSPMSCRPGQSPPRRQSGPVRRPETPKPAHRGIRQSATGSTVSRSASVKPTLRRRWIYSNWSAGFAIWINGRTSEHRYINPSSSCTSTISPCATLPVCIGRTMKQLARDIDERIPDPWSPVVWTDQPPTPSGVRIPR